MGAVMLYCLSAWVLGASAFRAWWRRRAPAGDCALPPAVIQGLGSTLVCVSVWLGSTLFLQGADVVAARVLAAAGICSTGVSFAADILRPGVQSSFSKRYCSAAASLAVGFGVLLGVLYLRSYPRGEALFVAFPVHGSWRVITGGRTRLTNYHHDNPPVQNYAVDLVESSEMEATLGQPVFSPCNGVVTKVSEETETPEGNLIILKTTGGAEIWLAHLKEHSILVHEGETTQSGQQLAEVGATGSADEPHLHIHAQQEGRALPMLFGAQKSFLVRGNVARW